MEMSWQKDTHHRVHRQGSSQSEAAVTRSQTPRQSIHASEYNAQKCSNTQLYFWIVDVAINTDIEHGSV
jgi:hypothetical protein